MEKEHTLLDIKNLVVRYHTDDATVEAVNDVSLSLGRGETLGLVGETGAGKTTIALSIMRLIAAPPGKIEGGEILYVGDDLLQKTPAQMRKIRGREISMIFQDPMTALSPIETVGSQIAEVIRLHEKLTRAEALEKAQQALQLVGIPGERHCEYPHQFSGGMKQRIVIAIALACSPKLLIADEPTTALDVTIQAQVLDMINKLKSDMGTSMLMITHDLGIVAEMCDRVAVIYAGEIVELGNRTHIFDEMAHPYTLGLFSSLPSMTDENATRLKPIMGLMPDPANLPSGCKFHPRCTQCQDRCKTEKPALREVSPGHFVRCLLKSEWPGG